MSKSVLLLYPNQLFAVEQLPKEVDQVLLVEEPLLFGRDQQYPMFVHKQKLAFMRACMQRYMEEVLWPAGYQVEYIEFHHMTETGDIVNKLSHFDHVTHFDLSDDALRRRLQAAIQGLQHQPEVHILESPAFYLTKKEATDFIATKPKAAFSDFYLWQRERFNILIDPETYKPVGGKLIFEGGSKRLPKNHQLPSFQVYGSNKYVDEAREYVQHHFPDNPGQLDNFPWPTNYQEASAWLDDFLEERIDHFATYEDAIDGEAPWLYHSALAPVMNIGILNPKEVVERTLQRHEKKPVPIASLESFVRRVLGWREYVRAQYEQNHVKLRTANSFGHHRRLTADWYNGTTGIPPVDDAINKVRARAYAHNVERLMVIGNLMFLSDFHPDDIHRWYMEMYLDAYDWFSVPNVYGGQEIDSIITAKPYASSSNYVLKMSHYERGDWCDVWDGLYWRFVEKNKDRFAKNPHMKVALGQLDKLSENRRRIIGYRADDFLNTKTANS